MPPLLLPPLPPLIKLDGGLDGGLDAELAEELVAVLPTALNTPRGLSRSRV